MKFTRCKVIHYHRYGEIIKHAWIPTVQATLYNELPLRFGNDENVYKIVSVDHELCIDGWLIPYLEGKGM